MISKASTSIIFGLIIAFLSYQLWTTQYILTRVLEEYDNEPINGEEFKLWGGEGEREGDEKSEGEGYKKTTEKEKETQTCECVNCEEDEKCGHLQKGRNNLDAEKMSNDDVNAKKIHVVISHCKNDLDWFSNYIKGFNIASVHVISKCGVPVRGLSNNLSTGNIKPSIEVLSNVGRCDHSYTHYINTILDEKVARGEKQNSFVLFLKDTVAKKENLPPSSHLEKEWNDIKSMVQGAFSTNMFTCGTVLKKDHVGRSAYHNFERLLTYDIRGYEHNTQGYQTDQAKFISNYKNLGSFVNSLHVDPFPNVVHVCYCGVFAASVSNLKKTKSFCWNIAEEILTRGDNIEEGHYMQRSWGMLLSTPLLQFQVGTMIKCSSIFHHASLRGCLLMKYEGVKSCNIPGEYDDDDDDDADIINA